MGAVHRGLGLAAGRTRVGRRQLRAIMAADVEEAGRLLRPGSGG